MADMLMCPSFEGLIPRSWRTWLIGKGLSTRPSAALDNDSILALRPSVELDVDKVLEACKRNDPKKSLMVPEEQLEALCVKASQVFMSESPLLEVCAPVIVCGTIHGQHRDLMRIFKYGGFPPESRYLFLGGYVNYGRWGLETILMLLCLKVKHPEHIFLLRGADECARVTQGYGFYDECKRKYSVHLWKSICRVFDCLPPCAVIDEKIFCVYGGLSPKLESLDQIKQLKRPSEVPDSGLLWDLLNALPDRDLRGWAEIHRRPSPFEPAVAGIAFGTDVVTGFLERHDLDLIVRSSEVVEDGYEFFAERQLITLFSAPATVGHFDNAGAVMTIADNLMCSFKVLKPSLHAVGVSAAITYLGHILPDSGIECITSFPGKYAEGWNAVVKEGHRQSVACVFLPNADAGLGQHERDPDSPTKQCYCHTIYGKSSYDRLGYLVEVKPGASAEKRAELEAYAAATNAHVWQPTEGAGEAQVQRERQAAVQEAKRRWQQSGMTAAWGCKWFPLWKKNVQKAVQNKQRLVVYYFKGQVGQGKVLWEDLALTTTDNWDGIGLGGSQKCEVAWLDKMCEECGPAYSYEERDVAGFIHHYAVF